MTAAEISEKELIAETIKLVKEKDAAFAYQHLRKQSDLGNLGARCNSILNDFYYKEKDLTLSNVFASTVIHNCLTEAKQARKRDEEAAKRWTMMAKMVGYNAAANCWAGWNDEGIVIEVSDSETALDFAKTSLRLVQELKQDETKRANCEWLVGAQYLALKKYDLAIKHFTTSMKLNRDVNNEAEQLMSAGYVALTNYCRPAAKPEATNKFKQAIVELKKEGSDDAKFFASQIETAAKVYKSK